jgi:hypothetical protein
MVAARCPFCLEDEFTGFNDFRLRDENLIRTGHSLTTFCRNSEEIGLAVVEKNEFKAAEWMSAIRRKYMLRILCFV